MNRISEVGISFIASFEGCRLSAYQCPSGVWTIGYGHTKGVKKGDTLKSEKEAKEMLINDLINFENAVNKYDHIYSWSQSEFDALVSFAFNCGVGNLNNLLKSGTRDRSQILSHIPLYNKSRGIALSGLTRRRKAEAELFASEGIPEAEYFPIYTGESAILDEVLKAVGATDFYKEAKNYLKREPIATANGISTYKGRAEQNLKLITLAKEGRLRKP